MSNVQTPIARLEKLVDEAEQVTTKTAKSFGLISRHPQESTVEEPVSNASSPPKDLLIDLYLPEEIKQFLEKPLEMLGLQLEPTETVHNIEKKIIRHYSIRVLDGKLVLIYLNPKDAQTTWGEFHYFGSLFAKKNYSSIVVFSNAKTLQEEYEEVLSEWEDSKSFEKIGLVLEKTIEVLRNPEIKIVIGEIKNKFGLPEEASADDTAMEERAFDMVKLSELISEYFDLEEFKDLCFTLQKYVEFDNLEGEGKDAKIQNLVKHAKRHGYLPQLIGKCQEKRVHVPWDEVEVKGGDG